jgi:iron complex outermembrane receptor protein
VGYGAIQITLDLKHGHEEDFDLTEDQIHLDELNIRAQRTDTPITQSVGVLAEAALAQTRGQTLAQSLSALTGLTTLQTGSNIAKPVIHGLHSNRVLILNNGVRQEGQQWGSEHAPEIDPFVATRLKVVKGAAGVRYGSDAIAGVVIVEPDELPYAKALGGELNSVLSTNGRQGVLSATLEGGREQWAWRSQATIKRGGDIRTPQYFLLNTGLREINFSTGVGYRKKGFGVEAFYSRFNTQLGIYEGAHIGSVTDLLTVIERGEPLVRPDFGYEINRPFQDVQHDLLKAEAHYHFPDGNRLQWTVARQYNQRAEYDLHRPRNDSLAALNRPELLFRLTTLTTDLLWDHKPIVERFTGQVGLSTLYQYNLMSGRPLIPNFDQWNVGLFWIGRLTLPKWEWEIGLRYDVRQLTTYRIVLRERRMDKFQFQNPSGTIGLTHRLGQNWFVKANIGTAWRPPNVNELFSDGVHHGAAAYEQGDASLRPEIAFNHTATLHYDDARWAIELGGYYNYLQNFIYLKPQPSPILTIRGAFPYFVYNQTDATFGGLDLSLKRLLTTQWEWTTKASYLRVYDRRNDTYLVMIPPNRLENTLRYRFRERGGTRTDSFVELRNLWVGEQRRVPPQSDFAPPPAAYVLWDLNAGTSWQVSSGSKLNLSVSIQNLLDTSYRDYLNRLRYYAHEMGRNVSLRANWTF